MKLVCGPMATISHPAFRILLEKFGGCDEYFTEMINAGTLLTGGPFEKFYVNPAPNPSKIVWQLTGHDTKNMVAAAENLLKLPGIGLDLNMGCSAPDIYRFGAGIAWMLKPISQTQEMVRAVGDRVLSHNQETGENKRFSVKLRLGDDDFTDDKFFAFCDMLVENGVRLLTLHPRTKKEKLIRPPRYFYCQKLKERYKTDGVEVYLNGNVKDKTSFDYAVKTCPDIDGVMISRAAVQKPWIFADLSCQGGNFAQGVQISGVCEQDGSTCGQKIFPIDMQQLAYDYISDIEIYQPKEFWKSRLQRFFTYFSFNFKFSHYAQTQFLNARDNEDLRLRIGDFFQKCPEERFREKI